MKKIIFAFTSIATFIFLTMSSCRKSNDYSLLPPKLITNTSSNEAEGDPTNPAYWQLLVAAVVVVIALSQGQRQPTTTTTTIYADGSSTTTTSGGGCDGVGTCAAAASMVSNGNPLSSTYPYNNNVSDYRLTATIELLSNGDIVYAVDPKRNSAENFSRFFYADHIKFLSPGDTYIVDNPTVLETLSLNNPIEIIGNTYKVNQKDDGSKYIIIGHK